MTERNAKLFYEVASIIEADPARYDQWSWGDVVGVFETAEQALCNTVACIAGHAVIASGRGSIRPGTDAQFSLQVDGNDAVRVGQAAQQELGLTDCEADRLFHVDWRPDRGLSVPDALRLLGDGADIEDVSA